MGQRARSCTVLFYGVDMFIVNEYGKEWNAWCEYKCNKNLVCSNITGTSTCKT